MKALITLSLLTFTLNAAAQTEKGSFLVGAGLANVSAISNEGSGRIDGFSFSIHPRVGAFVSNKVALGTQIALGYTKEPNSVKTFTYGIEPFIRYYTGKGNTRFFAEAGVGYYRSDIKGLPVQFMGTETLRISQVGYGLGPGIVHFVSSSVGLEAGLMVRRIVTEGHGAYVPQLNFGFNVYLPGAAKQQ